MRRDCVNADRLIAARPAAAKLVRSAPSALERLDKTVRVEAKFRRQVFAPRSDRLRRNPGGCERFQVRSAGAAGGDAAIVTQSGRQEQAGTRAGGLQHIPAGRCRLSCGCVISAPRSAWRFSPSAAAGLRPERRRRQAAEQKPAAETAKEGQKKIDEIAEAARVLTGPAGNPECVWLGRRVVSLLWRDDLDTAFRHLDLYDRFGCPSSHIQAAFRCLVRQGNIDPKAPDTLNGRVHACWLNPGLPPTAGGRRPAAGGNSGGTDAALTRVHL